MDAVNEVVSETERPTKEKGEILKNHVMAIRVVFTISKSD